jgi:hypothetical protein
MTKRPLSSWPLAGVAIAVGLILAGGILLGPHRPEDLRPSASVLECRRLYGAAHSLADSVHVDAWYPQYGTDVHIGYRSMHIHQCGDYRRAAALGYHVGELVPPSGPPIMGAGPAPVRTGHVP